MKSPFILENQTEYISWRDKKLSLYPKDIESLSISFDFEDIDINKITQLKKIVKDYNFAIYNFSAQVSDEKLQEFCVQLNLMSSVSNLLADQNGISSITDNSSLVQKKSNIEYIPYTNKPLNWHTDGYYHPLHLTVKSFLLHCNEPAQKGGENLLLDHEILYIFLRDHNPDFIDILMQENIMEIPKNKNSKSSSSSIGPVFYIDTENFLNMRFTSRQQNIIWRKDDMIKKIKNYISSFILDDSKYIFKLLLKKNQGYLANNILHKREEYLDGENKRLLKRLRFSERIR
jgi:hypothetical protein